MNEELKNLEREQEREYLTPALCGWQDHLGRLMALSAELTVDKDRILNCECMIIVLDKAQYEFTFAFGERDSCSKNLVSAQNLKGTT